ncbi:MAG: hypothetical protein QOF89_1405 [Acidobacteriota bacterium]|jgi:hypothetical protein|nr:hypothetical protein [Acidobacteriota bacterium]
MTDHAPRLTLDDWLRAAYEDPAAGCPPPESWLEEELAARTPEERRRLEAHAEHCPACAAERNLARDFDAGAEAPGVRPEDVAFVVSRLEAASPVRTRGSAKVVPFRVPKREAPQVVPTPSRSWDWRRLAAAAVVILAAGLGYQLFRPAAPPLPTPQNGGVVRGGEVEAVSPVGEVAGIPSELRWAPRPGASSYRVRLSAVDDTILWEATVPAPPARLPAEVVRTLHRAVVYVWSVEALGPAGERLGASEPARFRARPSPEGTGPL